MILVAESRVVIQRDLAVEGDNFTVGRLHQRVDFHERGVFFRVHVPQFDDDVRDLFFQVLVKAGRINDFFRLCLVDPHVGIHADARKRIGALHRKLLDLHATLDRAHGKVAALRTVEQDREVILFGNVRAGGDEYAVHGVALDVHPEYVCGSIAGFFGGPR